jgi:hypothetical protein
MDYWNEMPHEAREAIELGDASMAALKRGETIERWLNVGRGLLQLQTQAMRLAGSNSNKGRPYRDAWTGLADHAAHLRDIEQSTRSHAVWLATEWEAVNRWLHTLAVNKRLMLNHPRAVHRSYDLAHLPPAQPKPSARIGLQDQVIRLQEENDMLRNRQGEGFTPRGAGFMPGTSADAAAEQIAGHHRPEFLRKLAQALVAIAEREERQDRIERPRRARK